MNYKIIITYLILCIYTNIHTESIALTVPENFGKTHFIVGVPIEQVTPKPLPAQKSNSYCCAFFAPDDNLQALLCQYINQEKKGIDIAIFSFTNKQIADALITAHKNGIKIRIITDPSGAHDRFSKIPLLKEIGIPIYIYNNRYRKKSPSTLSDIMHHKIVIFKNNKDKKPCVWTGSFNFTKSAAESNQENILILDRTSIVKQYENQFERLLSRCKVSKH